MARQELHTGFTVGTEVAYLGGFTSDRVYRKVKIVAARPSQGYVEIELSAGNRKKFRLCNTWQDRCYESGKSSYRALIEIWSDAKHAESNRAHEAEKADDTAVYDILNRVKRVTKWDIKRLNTEQRAELTALLDAMGLNP
jgi:hypothetical protein